MSSLSFYDDYDQVAKKGEETTSGLFSPFTFLVIALILSLFGLMLLYSATFDYAVENNHPHYYYLSCQTVGMIIGFFIGLSLRLLPISCIKKAHYPISALTILAFVIYFINSNSHDGYITIGNLLLINVPVLAVFSMVLSFSSIMPEIENSDRFGLLYFIAIVFYTALALLSAFAGGLGSFIVYAFVLILMMKPCGITKGYIILAVLFSAVLLGIMLFSFPPFFRSFSSSIMPVNNSYYDNSLLVSLSAIKEGGLSGVGIGKGIFKMMNIEGTECRFIFTTVAEELGLLGVCCIMLLIFLLSLVAIRTEKRAIDADNKFIASTAIGISAMIVLPFSFSIMHVLGIFPFSGTSMPLFSFCPGNEALYIASMYLLYKEVFIIGRRKNDKIE